MKERWAEWLCLFVTTLFLPGMVTLFVSGTGKEQASESGISILYENGEKVDMEEFLVYMLAGQIDLDVEKETLKAQAVICRTNLMRELDEKTEEKASKLSVVYLSPDKFESSFGDKSREEVKKKIRDAVQATKGQTMVYDDHYIEALYHAVSIGTTISSEEYFGKARPYLVPVESSQDVEAEEYMTMKTWTKEEANAILLEAVEGQAAVQEDLLSSVKIEEKTENGYVKTVAVGSEHISGDEWKALFDLNSTNFYLEEQEDRFRIIVLGKGHGIGMSQFGANELAKEGWEYRDILMKYYNGVTFYDIEQEKEG